MTKDWVWILTDAQTERVNECFWLEIAKNKSLLGINNTIDINIFQVKDDSVMISVIHINIFVRTGRCLVMTLL